ncbi:MAG: hypothetical protein AAF757_02265 [Cyanobacteria bacterium P01_D01_bin.116]
MSFLDRLSSFFSDDPYKGVQLRNSEVRSQEQKLHFQARKAAITARKEAWDFLSHGDYHHDDLYRSIARGNRNLKELKERFPTYASEKKDTLDGIKCKLREADLLRTSKKKIRDYGVPLLIEGAISHITEQK